MYLSRLVAAIVIVAAFLAGVGTLVTFATNISRIAVLLVLALVVLSVVGMSALGGRSRRWRQNPYW